MADIEIRQLKESDIQQLGIKSWPIWEKEISRFDWAYSDTEQCFILKGDIEVTTPSGLYQIKPGDFVTFKKGLSCTWNIKDPVKKHYNFL